MDAGLPFENPRGDFRSKAPIQIMQMNLKNIFQFFSFIKKAQASLKEEEEED